MTVTAKSVLITAGASGIGRVIAEAFLAEGHQVHICDISAEAIATIKADHPLITSTLGDVSLRGKVDQLFLEFQSLYG
jgi:short-subunit dehydrogenase involved in D-alanine esterification of teichoic acids